VWVRVRAGISYALSEAMNDGHCGLPADELSSQAVELLAIPQELVQTAREAPDDGRFSGGG
jgi:exodeoxyribonuclease V alpha subunit